MTEANVVKIKKPSFTEKFKSKNAPTISGVETLLTVLPILKIGDVGDWAKLHPSEDDYWTPELCFVAVPIKGTKRDALHLIDDDLAIQYLPAKKIKRHRLALACKPNDVFFFCIVPSQNLDNAYNADAHKACYQAQTHWIQALSRRSEGAEGYEIKFAQDQAAFPEPKWPSRTLDELLEVTFKEANIDHDRHPGLLRLIGARQDLTLMSSRRGYFRRIVVLDFEYEIEDGGLPNPLCCVADILDENLRHIETVRRWRGEFGTAPPFPIDDDTLVVGYSLWAEMTCFLVLGWRFPKYVYDLHTAYLAVSNILLPYDPDTKRIKQRKGLSYACAAYGIEGWEGIDKPEMAKAIGEGRWREYGQPAVFYYCEKGDVYNSAELLRRQLAGYRHFAPIDPQLVMHWSEYSAKTVARIQARGMPIDMPLWNLVQENKTAVVVAFITRFDPSQGSEYPIYSPEGEFSSWRFEQWPVSAGITYWPRLDSGALQLDGDAFRMMYGAHPAIEGLHALRDSLGVIVRARIPIGRDGRNCPRLFPFGTATGRNAHSKSLYNAHASMRSFMQFSPDKIGLYIDERTQEVGVAAHRSGDEQLAEDYSAGDIYYALAKLCGLTTETDVKIWKNNPEGKLQRPRMKPLQLGINYGMGVMSLARGLGRHPLIASEVIIRHKQRYPRFWRWREEMVDHALLERKIMSEFDGWPLYLSHSPNKRTLYNFPMQSGGAECLRLGANRLCEAGLIPNMLVHDGILLELDNEEQVQHAIEIFRIAGTEVCGGLRIDVDVDQKLIGGARYRDKRPVAIQMWGVVMDVLHEIGAIRDVG